MLILFCQDIYYRDMPFCICPIQRSSSNGIRHITVRATREQICDCCSLSLFCSNVQRSQTP